ncbi:DUF4381 domain-containing protein [Rhodobacteraceae bacterium NNCM2]|nr:DUF4381 domain-containing protein [Coraliihabitans acroporae]
MAEDLSRLNLVELLDLLEPPPEPPPISMLPQTMGWVWLALVVIAAFGFTLWKWRVRHAANAYRRAALAELQAASDPAAIARIVRRTALMAFPRAEVAGLYGEEWLAFLDRTGGGTVFREGAGRAIATAPYDRGGATSDLAGIAAAWIRDHRAGAS